MVFKRVTCPACAARCTFDENVLEDHDYKVRCARCKTVFLLSEEEYKNGEQEHRDKKEPLSSKHARKKTSHGGGVDFLDPLSLISPASIASDQSHKQKGFIRDEAQESGKNKNYSRDNQKSFSESFEERFDVDDALKYAPKNPSIDSAPDDPTVSPMPEEPQDDNNTKETQSFAPSLLESFSLLGAQDAPTQQNVSTSFDVDDLEKDRKKEDDSAQDQDDVYGEITPSLSASFNPLPSSYFPEGQGQSFSAAQEEGQDEGRHTDDLLQSLRPPFEKKEEDMPSSREEGVSPSRDVAQEDVLEDFSKESFGDSSKDLSDFDSSRADDAQEAGQEAGQEAEQETQGAAQSSVGDASSFAESADEDVSSGEIKELLSGDSFEDKPEKDEEDADPLRQLESLMGDAGDETRDVMSEKEVQEAQHRAQEMEGDLVGLFRESRKAEASSSSQTLSDDNVSDDYESTVDDKEGIVGALDSFVKGDALSPDLDADAPDDASLGSLISERSKEPMSDVAAEEDYSSAGLSSRAPSKDPALAEQDHAAAWMRSAMGGGKAVSDSAIAPPTRKSLENEKSPSPRRGGMLWRILFGFVVAIFLFAFIGFGALYIYKPSGMTWGSFRAQMRAQACDAFGGPSGSHWLSRLFCVAGSPVLDDAPREVVPDERGQMNSWDKNSSEEDNQALDDARKQKERKALEERQKKEAQDAEVTRETEKKKEALEAKKKEEERKQKEKVLREKKEQERKRGAVSAKASPQAESRVENIPAKHSTASGPQPSGNSQEKPIELQRPASPSPEQSPAQPVTQSQAQPKAPVSETKSKSRPKYVAPSPDGVDVFFSDVAYERTVIDGTPQLNIKGYIVNSSKKVQYLPSLHFVLLNADHVALQDWDDVVVRREYGREVRIESIGPGEKVAFETHIKNPSPKARTAEIEFIEEDANAQAKSAP